jgi:monofunctional glycosyltransferase
MMRLLRRMLFRLLLAIALVYTIWIGGLVYVRAAPPPLTMVRLQHAVGSVLDQRRPRQRQTWIPLDALPVHVPRAVVAAEDSRFYTHRGFDLEEMRAARRQAERTGGPIRGASTITQQLVKNLFLTTHRSLLRKGVEMSLTPFAELILSKDRILELYLNVAEWGPGIYGIEEAARFHYGVSAPQLTRDQAARLAAILPAPQRRDPRRMGAYAATIQQRMRAMGW